MQRFHDGGSEGGSVFQSNLPLEAKLEKARTELLDLSARNRLLNIPRGGKSAKSLEVVDELTSEIYRLLVRETRPFTFLAGRQASAQDVADDPDEVFFNLPVLDDEPTDKRGVAARHVDTKLQTRLTEAGLQKRLLDLYHDARTLEEEQGVNILFLALGSLKWIDKENVRYAPLILVPVALERGNAAERFKLRWRGEDPAANLSLEAFLERVHGVKLPAFEGGDDFDPVAYMRSVAKAVEGKAGWTVAIDDIVLGFFSFAKFLMYRDLDPENWPKGAKLSEHEIVRGLVSDGFDADSPLLDEDARIDEHIPPADMVHIVDSDSSQTLAVHEVRRGRNLVIQGPPGTGKSQTIANVIGAAVAEGKTVLFVAEKMAALEVVKRRLDRTGVGDVCLELHSNKANKRAVLAELSRTWELGAPKGSDPGPLNARLVEARNALNEHADRLHRPLGAAGYTPYQVIGHLTRLRQAGQQPSDIALDEPAEWSSEDLHQRSTILAELVERVKDIGVPAAHPWRGIGLNSALPADVDRLVMRIEALAGRLAGMVEDHRDIARRLEQAPPANLDDLTALSALAERLAGAPDLEPHALGAELWSAKAGELDALLGAGERLAALRSRIGSTFRGQAWEEDVAAAREALAPLEAAVPLPAFNAAATRATGLPLLLEEGERLANALGRAVPPADLRALRELSRVGERVAAAPEVDPAAFAAAVWETGIERAADLAATVQALESAKGEIGNGLSDGAWQVDLSEARRALAAHGGSFFKFLNGEWRAANRLVRSYLTDPNTPLASQLALLDALGRGRAAAATIQSEGSFGHEAFGSAWRGERSASAPLLAVVEWMRSLKGLGAEPRLVASRSPDRDRLAALATSVARLCEDAEPAASGLWRDLGTARSLLFGNAADHASAPVEPMLAGARRLDAAHRQYAALALSVSPDLQVRRQALADLAEAQELRSRLASNAALGEAAYGTRWKGEDSDWGYLRFAARWIGDNLDIHQLAARSDDRGGLHQRALAAETRLNAFLVELEVLLKDLRADETALVRRSEAASLPAERLAAQLAGWGDQSELLSKWVAYRTRAERASALGLADLVRRLHDGSIETEQAQARFEMSYFEAVFADQVAREPELAQFDGQLHDRIVRSFADLDLQRIRQSALDVVRAHHRRIPPSSGGKVGPLGILKGEIARRRGHMPIRKLMQQAAPAIQALKPVFMMSPLSVAQYLEPGALTFDLLVMDEASQIQPVDALGAVARCRQVVVVGDPKQLPPTAFFSKMVGNDGEDEEDRDGGGTRVADIESILGLFTARGLPTRMLRWHYRSRHQSLIAVSNKQFYENKLFIVPSPYLAEAGLGLRFHPVDGIFETGSSRTNPIEAKRVAQAIIGHAITHPEQSLGVVAFSAAQRRAIQNQLEILRKALPPQQEAFFQDHPAEPFFIKNLENVQGDERDVIFISVGYGPTAPGLKPPMRFGPVGSEGGERRLNVLISRAKKRCEVFASMTDEDIDADFAASRKGVFALKLFMHFARTGKMSLAEANARDLDSVFELQVQEALQARGYKVDQQVGIAGFFIDLAVADPDRADRYLIGIECDGVAYHEARSARDRDRLRQAILEDHGWIIHRIWSTDWFRRPKAELDRLIASIEASKVELAVRGARAAERVKTLEIVTVDREDVTEIGLAAVDAAEPAATPYVEAVLNRPSHLVCELHETPIGVLTQLAEQVVAIEGPVHIDEIINRIRDAWGLKRAGARIQECVENAVEFAVRQHRIEKSGWFYSVPGSEIVVRDRSAAGSSSLRKPECLPPAEVRAAVIAIVGKNFGASEEQAVQAAARAFGFKATSSQLRDLMSKVINDMVADEALVRRETLIELGPNAPAAAAPALPPTPVERLIAEGESETLEFKETLRWDVRQRDVNKKLEEVVVKTVAAFGNHRGGTLLIGVADDGSVTGIESDVRCTGGSLDKFQLHIGALLNANFPGGFVATKVKISFPVVDPHQVCRIDVEKSRSALYVKTADRGGAMAERLFVRSGNSSREIPPSQLVPFVNEHFRS